MKLTYIYHSGFALEWPEEGVTIIVDFYRDADGVADKVAESLIRQAKHLYVLSTHFHPDHFDPTILSWKETRPDIRYIFSKDILKRKRAKQGEAHFLRKGECYVDEFIRVDACGSTDVGSSFLIRLGEWTVFHAGDLNNWHWSEESTAEEVRKAEGDYLAELAYLRTRTTAVDVAMFPVDGRMGHDYMRGARQFIEHIKTSVFVPMHFEPHYEAGHAFRPEAEQMGVQFVKLTHQGQTVVVNKEQTVNLLDTEQLNN